MEVVHQKGQRGLDTTERTLEEEEDHKMSCLSNIQKLARFGMCGKSYG